MKWVQKTEVGPPCPIATENNWNALAIVIEPF